MKKAILINLVVGTAILLVAIFFIWRFARPFFFSEELLSKREWSVVQSVEWARRDKPAGKLEIVQKEEFFLAGIPTQGGKKETWVMLNPRNPPYYKQLPEGNYSLSKKDMEQILATGAVVSTVENCLESHLEPEK